MTTNDAEQPFCFGLIGGLGPAATVEYYRALMKALAEPAPVTDCPHVRAAGAGWGKGYTGETGLT